MKKLTLAKSVFFYNSVQLFPFWKQAGFSCQELFDNLQIKIPWGRKASDK